MRYLMTTSLSCVSMWMSLARRWMALKTVESTSLMTGRGVGGDAVDRQDLLALVVFLHQLDAEILRRLLQHALGRLRLLQDLLDRRRHADAHLDRLAEEELQLVEAPDVLRVLHHQGDAAGELRLRDEAVAQHEVEGNGVEQIVVDPEVLEVDELEPVPRGEGLDGAALVGGAQGAVGRQEVVARRQGRRDGAQLMPPMALNIGM
jgi:hypothetical protein